MTGWVDRLRDGLKPDRTALPPENRRFIRAYAAAAIVFAVVLVVSGIWLTDDDGSSQLALPLVAALACGYGTFRLMNMGRALPN